MRDYWGRRKSKTLLQAHVLSSSHSGENLCMVNAGKVTGIYISDFNFNSSQRISFHKSPRMMEGVLFNTKGLNSVIFVPVPFNAVVMSPDCLDDCYNNHWFIIVRGRARYWSLCGRPSKSHVETPGYRKQSISRIRRSSFPSVRESNTLRQQDRIVVGDAQC